MQVAEESQRRVLILGGSCFMGKALLDRLEAQPTRTLICCINRGKVYWNNEARKQHPSVLAFYADRKEHTDTTNTIRFVSRHIGVDEGRKWDCVFDFSGFRWRDVQSVTKAIKGLAERYVFVSSDSVYNNSTGLKTPIREDDFDIEQECKRIRASTESKDTYGYNKLKCEVYLRRTKPLPYTCIRLPDVFGPYDNTERFWCTVKWVQQHQQHPLPLTADEETQSISLVDSLSVAMQLANLVDYPAPLAPAYNLCCLQQPTVKKFLEMVGEAAGESKLTFRAQTNRSSNNFYPSVEVGAISCEKAVRELKWSPLPMMEAVRQSVGFFLKEGDRYPEEKKQMEKEFRRKVVEHRK